MAVVVGCLYLDLFLSEAQSLKDRRRVLRSFKERLHQKFPVAAAEVGDADLWQKAELAIVSVANDQRHVDEVLSTLADWASRQHGFVVSGRRLEWR